MNLLIHDIAAAIERDAWDEAPRRGGYRRTAEKMDVETALRVWDVDVGVVEGEDDRPDALTP